MKSTDPTNITDSSADAPSDTREYPARPIVGVGAVVFYRNSVLLIRRGRPPRLGEWSLPGGAQRVGETVQQTAAREVMEETGVEIGPPHFLEVINSITRDGSGSVQYHYTIIDFWAEYRTGTLRAQDDAEHAEWIELERLEALPMWSKTREVIRRAESMRRTPGIPTADHSR